MDAISTRGRMSAAGPYAPTAHTPARQAGKGSAIGWHPGGTGGAQQRFNPVAASPAGPQGGLDCGFAEGGPARLRSERPVGPFAAAKGGSDAQAVFARRPSVPSVQPTPAPQDGAGAAGPRIDLIA